jgi:predicted amidohydrolase YtcJ
MAVRPGPPDARLLFAGGPILTMVGAGRPTALAVRGDRIVAVGSLTECRDALGAAAREVDLAGRCLMPGFVDAHCHPLMLAQTDGWLDASPEAAPTIDALVDLLRARAAEMPPGVPLRAYGHDYRRIPEFRQPRATDLDRAATDREIYVMNVSGHGGVLNSFGLAAHGITSATPDIDGGHIGRGPDGSPDGLLWDAACDLLTGDDGVKIGRHGPNIHLPESPARLTQLLEDAQATFLRAGVTTVVDAQVTRREMETYLRWRAAGSLRVRIEMLVLSALLDDVLRLGIVERLGDDWCAIAGIKLYADGALGAGTAWFPEGYANQPDQHGQLYHEPAAYQTLVRRAHAAGLQTATHAQSPGAIGMVLDAIECAQRSTPRDDARHRIEHCGLPTDAQVERMARLDVVPVVQPGHHEAYGDGVIRSVGRELGERYNPMGSFARAGVRFALSSDAPVARPHPLRAIRAAVDRRTVSGTVLGGPELRIDVATALRAHTLDAAFATHRERMVGSLEVGKLADLVLLSADPLAVELSALDAIRVEETWVGGVREV